MHVGLKTIYMRTFLIGLLFSLLTQTLYAPYVDKSIPSIEEQKRHAQKSSSEGVANRTLRVESIEELLAKLKMSYYFDEKSREKVTEISLKYNIKEQWLYKTIFLESGGNPQSVNKLSKATGLIQWIPSTAAKLGTSTDSIYEMNTLEQLHYVDRYLEINMKGKKIRRFSDLYLLILSPSHANAPDSSVLGRYGEKVYNLNKTLDVDKDSVLTVGDIRKYITSKV